MKRRLLTFALVFFSGLFFTLSVVYYSEWRYEEDILNIMARHINASFKKKDLGTIVDSAMYLTHKVVDPMADVYGDEDFSGFKNMFTSPSFMVYYYGKGACGGYSSFTSRLLDKMNIKTRFVLQNVDGTPGGHITLAIENGPQLLLIDPLFSWSFRDSLGRMSDIRQVAANWPYYLQRRPQHYRPSYNYQNGWTYTNWDKFGAASRAAYNLGVFLVGKQKMDAISIRAFMLGATKKYFYLCFCLFICCSAMLIKRFINYRAVNSAPKQISDATDPQEELEYAPGI